MGEQSHCPGRAHWLSPGASRSLLALLWLLSVPEACTADVPAVAVATAEPRSAAPRFAWWEGDLLGMSARKVLALTGDMVVMCYARADGGGCKAAASAFNGTFHDQARAAESSSNATGTISIARDPRLLPGLPWGAQQLFHAGGSVTRVEAERLASDRFVVCFQRSDADGQSIIACNVGVIAAIAESLDGQEAVPQLLEFGKPLEMGPGSLVAVSVLEAGKSFAVCHRALPADGVHPLASNSGHSGSGGSGGSHPMTFACNWAEVHVTEIGAGLDVSLAWTDDVALEVVSGTVESS